MAGPERSPALRVKKENLFTKAAKSSMLLATCEEGKQQCYGSCDILHVRRTVPMLSDHFLTCDCITFLGTCFCTDAFADNAIGGKASRKQFTPITRATDPKKN